jgi:RNA polymerase sigma-70 factor, ECF subfamily
LARQVRSPVESHATPGPAEPGDEALMEAGTAAAFEQLVRRHYARVVRFCQRSTGSDAIAEELAQETFVRLWRARARYEPTAGFRVFLYTVARNLCRATHRDEGRRGLRSVSLEPERLALVADDAPLAHAEVERRQDAQRVHQALARLPEVQREALVLRMIEGLDYREIAAVLGRSESTLRSQVFYGLKSLKELLPP